MCRLSEAMRVQLSLAHTNQLFVRLIPFIARTASLIAGGARLGEAALRSAALWPELAEHFELPGSAGERGFGARPAVAFPDGDRLDALVFEDAGGVVRYRAELDDDILPDLAAFFRAGAVGLDAQAVARTEDTLPGLLDDLRAAAIVVDGPPPAAGTLVDGLTRLQHACVVVRHGDDAIIVDPHFHATARPGHLRDDLAIAAIVPHVRAIAITHSHLDHFHVPTLMMFPRDTPILVPVVPRASMLCPDLAALLRGCGFTDVRPLAWYGPPVQVGAIAVRALPFFGEQPLADQPWRDPALRNWGNTYHVRTPRLASWFLADAGDDPGGAMAEVAAEVLRTLGPVDVVLGNLREFQVGEGKASPFYITGLGQYWLALTPEQIQDFPALPPRSLSLGPEGVARICRAAGARHVLPYAHWWERCGAPVEGEAAQVDQLAAALAGTPTRALRWHIGDAYQVGRGGALELRPGAFAG